MTSASETAEDRIVSAAFPAIRVLCQGRWLNLEFEDRFVEALLLFVEKLRSEPLTSGHFFKDFLIILTQHMDKLNRKTPSMRFGHFSLDTPMAGSEEDSVNGHAVLHSQHSDFSRLSTVEFISSLTDDEKEIVCLRILGYGKREIAELMDISVYHLEKVLSNIRRHYVEWSLEE